jgi:6-phosphogluconolactonase
LLQHVPIPSSQVYTIAADQTPQNAAKTYAQHLDSILPKSSAGVPIFDAILLGMGPGCIPFT